MFDLGLRIKELRVSRNMSQETLGKKLNRSKSVICAYENNVRIPPLEVLRDIAAVFNVSLDYLAGNSEVEMVSVDGLTAEQKEIILSLLSEFRKSKPNYLGLTDSEQAVLNRVLVELSKKR